MCNISENYIAWLCLALKVLFGKADYNKINEAFHSTILEYVFQMALLSWEERILLKHSAHKKNSLAIKDGWSK